MSKEKENLENPFAGFNILDQRLDKSSSVQNLENLEEIIKDEKTEETEEMQLSEVIEDKVVEDTIEDTNQETETIEEADDFSFKPLIEHLNNKNILDFDETDLEDIDFSSEESLEKLTEKTLEKRFNQKLESYPEELKKAIDWVENGGDIKQFYDYYYNNVRYSDLNISSEDTELQKAILRDHLRAIGEKDENKIENKIEKYEISGILEDEAKDALEKLQILEKNQDEQKQKTQKEKAESERLKQIEEWNNLKKAVLEAEDIAGFKVTDKVKQQLWDHMTKPVDKSGKTKLQVNNETKGLKAKLLYAYLDMLDFDTTKLEKQVKTKVSSELRSKLGKFTDSKGKERIGRSQIDEPSESDFSAFRKLF